MLWWGWRTSLPRRGLLVLLSEDYRKISRTLARTTPSVGQVLPNPSPNPNFEPSPNPNPNPYLTLTLTLSTLTLTLTLSLARDV